MRSFIKCFLIAITLWGNTAEAQQSFTIGQQYLGSQISHISGCEGAQPNTYYTYQGLNAAGGPHFTYCNTCPGQGGGSNTNTTNTVVVPAPVVNVSTVDRELELQKLQLQQMELQLQAKALKQQRRANITTGILGGLGLANDVAQTAGLWKGKYQSNVNTNVFTTTGTTQLPTPTDWGPVNTPVPTPTPNNGPVFVPTWNTNSVPTGTTPPIIQQPGDWGPVQ